MEQPLVVAIGALATIVAIAGTIIGTIWTLTKLIATPLSDRITRMESRLSREIDRMDTRWEVRFAEHRRLSDGD